MLIFIFFVKLTQSAHGLATFFFLGKDSLIAGGHTHTHAKIKTQQLMALVLRKKERHFYNKVSAPLSVFL